MEMLNIQHLSFIYPNREVPALSDINLTVKQGEFIVVCGASGSGKTTLLRQLKPALVPHGMKTGEVFCNGTPLDELSPREATAKIGFVQQCPENQIVTDKVWHELAFGLESLGVGSEIIRLRTAEMASFFGIQQWFHQATAALSGGQKQLLNLASAMAMQPQLLILDEPTSQLDPIAAAEFLAAVAKINRELGTTVILTEHRLEEVFALCSRVLVMDAGQILCDGSPQEVGYALRETTHEMRHALPTPMRVWASAPVKSARLAPCPVSVKEGREWLGQLTINKEQLTIEQTLIRGMPVIKLSEVWFRYEKDAPDVVKGLNFCAYASEITAILGGNGAGKTTALSLMLGLHKPQRGKVALCEPHIAAVPQNPQALFVGKTVEEDLREVSDEISEIVRLCQLEHLLRCHPYDLSGGEQQRAALAKVLLTRPKILLLDEPTKGLDAQFKQVFAGVLRQLATQGVAIIMVSHDIEFCAEHSDTCALFFDGGVVAQNSVRAFFTGNSFYTTAANRMARHVLPTAMLAEDIILALGGDSAPSSDLPSQSLQDSKGNQADAPKRVNSKVSKKKMPKRTLAAITTILLSIPLTIAAGVFFWEGRRFYFIALLVLLQAMLPFAFVFEKRRPQARELVILAVLVALAVAGRSAFFMLPQFKPVAAMVIIAGAAFGGETGFLVGALTALVSNMMFGQGPWTPWQMFAFGLIGFLAGFLFEKQILPRGRVALCTFGGLATFVVYGGLLNFSAALMFFGELTPATLLATYTQGLVFDAMHALATIIFLAVAAQPMLKKLDRVKAKYGLVQH